MANLYRLTVAGNLFAWLVLLAGCSRGVSAIHIDGSSTVYPISSMITEKFGESHNAKIVVGYSGTGGGMDKFISGTIEICDASRKIKDTEVKRCQDSGIEFIELEIAYDGLAVVVSPANTWCDCLTVEQLKRMWEPGSLVKTWSDLDPSWPAEAITLYGPGTDSGTFEYFTEVIVGKAKSSRPDFQASEDDNVLVKGVESDKFALGYFGYAYYEENKASLKVLGIDSGTGCTQPTPETVSQNTYRPLSRPLFIYVRKDALLNPITAEFVKYYVENAAMAASEVGYVPVKADIHETNLQKLSEAIGH